MERPPRLSFGKEGQMRRRDGPAFSFFVSLSHPFLFSLNKQADEKREEKRRIATMRDVTEIKSNGYLVHSSPTDRFFLFYPDGWSTHRQVERTEAVALQRKRLADLLTCSPDCWQKKPPA
mmetsp:Transcript_46616/g.92058  ORF Transcript_46616/g.92058 Transcript_46616/m.92058 type:complete len:120 (-) Transcript_46616:810-1169(-)